MIGAGARLRARPPGLAPPACLEAGRRAACRGSRGYSLLELLFVAGLGTTLTAIAIPQALAGLDELRTWGATRYVSTRLQRARMQAVMQSTWVAIQFLETPDGYEYAVYVDRNGNGVLTREIGTGVDRKSGPTERLRDQFPGVEFGAAPGLPPVDPGGTPPGDDPIRLGAGSLASFSSLGNSSTGTVYIRGRRGAQYAVRIFGETGKTRMIKFDRRSGRWRSL